MMNLLNKLDVNMFTNLLFYLNRRRRERQLFDVMKKIESLWGHRDYNCIGKKQIYELIILRVIKYY